MTKKKAIGVGLAGLLFATLVFGALCCRLTPRQGAPEEHYGARRAATQAVPRSEAVIATWNLRGYPESAPQCRSWFSAEIMKIKPDVLCVEEIANQQRVDEFLTTENRFIRCAFHDSPDGQDNAIFCSGAIDELEDMPDPEGFQHPAQAAYVACGGFDAVVVAVHLSWTNVAMRSREKTLLHDVVSGMLRKDPDVIIVGDFNTKEPEIEDLAQSIGMQAMEPAGQDGVGSTWAGNRYDHFLISPDLASEEAETCRIETFSGADAAIAKTVSDHLPVVARFRTDEKFRDRR